MTPRPPLRAAGLLALFLALPSVANAQQPPAVPPPAGVEVLTRGPVHEAYALPAGQQAAPGGFAPKAPPAPVEELPPDQKPAGDDVRWISGYWQYDDERKDFVWVSGFWRVPPPGRVWVPGSWRETPQGAQWVGGFWGAADEPAQPGAPSQAQMNYLPEPPPSIEAGPPTPAPSEEAVYLPGTWVHRDRYVWQPGCWTDPRPGWVWTPASYRWTPAGFVFVDGFWDHPLEERGVLFPPVAFAPELVAAPGFAYTPAYAVQEQALFGSLFVGRGRGSYFFGDYFSPQYANAGYIPWCAGGGFGGGGFGGPGFGGPGFGGPQFGGGGFGFGGGGGGRGFGFEFGFQRGFRDPLFDYYRASRRNDPFWGGGGIGQLYAGRYRGDIGRPPRTLIQQNGLVNTVNNTTVVNNTTINNVTVVSPLGAGQRAGGRAFTTLAPDARTQYAGEAVASRSVAQQRTLIENQFAGMPPRPATAAPDSRRAALTLPTQSIARAQAPGVTVGGSAATHIAPARPQAARPVAQAGVTANPVPPRPATTAQPIPPQPAATPLPTARGQAPAGPQTARPVPPPAVNPMATTPPRPAVAQPRPAQAQSLPPAVPTPVRPAVAAPRPSSPPPAPTITRSSPLTPAPTPTVRPQPPTVPAAPAPAAPRVAPVPAPQQPAPPRVTPQQPAPRVPPVQTAPPQAVPQPPSAPRAMPSPQPAQPRAMPVQQPQPRAMPAPQPSAPPPVTRSAPVPSRPAAPAPAKPQTPPRPGESR